MIRKLRKKFILSAMLAVVLVLFVLVGAINVLNYRKIVTDADQVLNILADNNGSFPDAIPGSPDPEAAKNNASTAATEDTGNDVTTADTGKDTGTAYAGNDNGTNDSAGTGTTNDAPASTPDFPRNPAGDGMNGESSLFGFFSSDTKQPSAEMPYESRYFTVTIDNSGSVSSTNVERIAAVDADTAEEYAEQVMADGQTSGFVSFYRFRTVAQDDGSTLVIFLDCQRSLDNMQSFLLSSLLVSLIGIAAVLVLVILLSGRIIRPVEESYRKQKRFITDAGHDLKTPLTIIDADVSVAEMDTGTNEWLDDIKVQTKRMTDLTNDLIYLSRMDEGENKMVMIDFPLSDVITETVQSFRSRAQLENKTFDYQIEPMITYCGDEKYITRLVTILLDNALKYSDEKGTIRIGLKKRGVKGFELTVYNTSDNIDKDVLKHMFDRFYRADSSRNSSKGGYGIGLSIASAIVAEHKGKISASSADGRSMLITVTM